MKKIITLMGGSSVSYLIGFLIFILATRNFSKEEIGVYSIFLSYIAIASQLTTGKIELSIPLADHEDEQKILASSVISTIFISIIIGLFTLFYFPDKYFPFLEDTSMGFIILILILSIILNTLFNIMNIILTKYGNLALYGSFLIKLSFLRALGQLFSIFIIKSLILFIAFFTIPILLILYQSKISFFSFLKSPFEKTADDFVYVYQKYRNKIFHIMPASILNALTVYTIPIFLGYMYPLGVVGLYMLADKMISVPFRIISTALEANFVHTLSKDSDHPNIKFFILKYIIFYAIIFLCIYLIILYFVQSPYFTYIFSNDWKDINIYIGFISVLYALFFISSTVSKVILLGEETKVILLFDIMKITFLLMVYIFTIISHSDIETFLWFYVGSMSIAAIYLIYKSYRYA